MKKNVILFAMLTLFGMPSFTQIMSLCVAFGTYTDQADSGFVSLKGDIKESGVFNTTYYSNIEISEALKTEIYVMTTVTELVVDYGNFNTESEALAKVEALKDNFITCFPVVRFSDYTVDRYQSKQTNIIQQYEKGFGYYKANFKISKQENRYNVSFIYPSSSAKGLFGKNEPNITDFITVPMPLDNQQYSLDIRKLIEEGKNGFQNIKGEKFEATVNGFDCYSTNFKVAGVNNCYIEDRTSDIKKFVIPVVKRVNLESIQKMADVVLSNFMSALGPDYAFKVSKDQMVFDFVHKNRPFQKTATFLIENNDNLFDLTIYINSDI